MAGEPERAAFSFAQVTGALTGVAAFVYLTGGIALQLRLGLEGLPSSVAVPQLPREFVIGIGLLVAAPAIGLACLFGWVTFRHPWMPPRAVLTGLGTGVGIICYATIGGTVGRTLLAAASLVGLGLDMTLHGVRSNGAARRRWSDRDVLAVGLATGLLGYLVIGGLVVAKDPFPAKVCLIGGRSKVGVLIGETSGRTYIGDPRGSGPRHVVSIPQSEVVRVVVGGSPQEINVVRCDR
jgi:hypothetical protein